MTETVDMCAASKGCPEPPPATRDAPSTPAASERDVGHPDAADATDVADEEVNLEDDQDSDDTLDSVSGLSSGSSPVPLEPFKPLFHVCFADKVTKSDGVVTYTLHSRRACDDDGTSYMVQRRYEDFEYLEHCLTTSNREPGLIVPPLPEQPATTVEMVQTLSRRQLGPNSKALIGDQFSLDCVRLETYLELLLRHPVYGRDPALEKFLIQREPAPRVKVKDGLFERLASSLETRKEDHKDCEEFFQEQKEFVTKYGAAIDSANAAFNDVVCARQRLCSLLGHLATALALALGSNFGNVGPKVPVAWDPSCFKLSSSVSMALNGLQHHGERQCLLERSTLGAHLELYSRYLGSVRETLHCRTRLMLDYERCNRDVGRAAPEQRQQAVKAKVAAEKAFESCSDLARQEMKRFHRDRIRHLGRQLALYAEAELASSREACAILERSLLRLAARPRNCRED
ncbi:sorting nexin-32 [Ixodes scapularis]